LFLKRAKLPLALYITIVGLAPELEKNWHSFLTRGSMYSLVMSFEEGGVVYIKSKAHQGLLSWSIFWGDFDHFSAKRRCEIITFEH
jgi:hypothetical protein